MAAVRIRAAAVWLTTPLMIRNATATWPCTCVLRASSRLRQRLARVAPAVPDAKNARNRARIRPGAGEPVIRPSPGQVRNTGSQWIDRKRNEPVQRKELRDYPRDARPDGRGPRPRVPRRRRAA